MALTLLEYRQDAEVSRGRSGAREGHEHLVEAQTGYYVIVSIDRAHRQGIR